MRSKEWKNRHRMDGRDECSPTDETTHRLPGIDTVKDQNLILGPFWQLAAFVFHDVPLCCLRVHLGAGNVKNCFFTRPGAWKNT